MKIGVRAHDFGKLPVEVLAGKIKEKGFTCIQLALQKAISDIDCSAGKLSPGLASHIGEIFYKNGLQIAVLGCYINPVHPDLDERKRQLDRFKEHLRFARDFGCGIVATETGSFNADFSFHPDNHTEKGFKELMRSLKELLSEAEKFGVIIGMEGVAHYIADNPSTIKRILDEAGSNCLQIVYDPVNLITVENHMKQRSLMEESFELFGDRIVIIHAKDFTLKDGHIQTDQIGKGFLDYKFLIKMLKERKPYINFLMEDVDLNTIDETITLVRTLYNNT